VEEREGVGGGRRIWGNGVGYIQQGSLNLITASIHEEESKRRVAEILSISNRQQFHVDASFFPPHPNKMLRSSSSATRFIHSTRAFAHSFLAPDSPQLPYFVQRNSRGSIPVYTDIRNAGTRHLLLIRNVQGNVNVRPTPPLSFFNRKQSSLTT
jgi:hypothetical protein